MLILSFDTTSPGGGAGLYRDSETLGEARAGGEANYSITLFEMVDRLLADAGLHLAEVELFAAARGPGSFTGIRVGLAAAQAWAKAFDRPAQAVSVLEAMVEAARPEGSPAVPLLDARRGEFYLGVFRRLPPRQSGGSPGSLRLSGEGLVLGAAQIVALTEEWIRDGEPEAELIVRKEDQAALEFARQLPGRLQRTTVPGFLPGAIARAARRAACEGPLQKAEDLDAWYIRRSDAELHWQE